MPTQLSATPEDQHISADVVVVGSGIAGADIAHFLSRKGHNVILAESGRSAFDPAIQALYDLEFTDRHHRDPDEDDDFHEYLPSHLRGFNRLRQLGGTSLIWTGKWRVFEERDFEGRSWVPNSEWPIAYADLLPAYKAVIEDYDLKLGPDHPPDEEFEAKTQILREFGCEPFRFFQNERTYTSLNRISEAEDAGLRVLVDATVVRIELTPDGGRAAAVVCRSIEGAERRIEAAHIVLATGGLETPRILLASNRERPEGLGNARDLVGRFYQDHFKINRAKFRPGPSFNRVASLFQTAPRPRALICFALSSETQQELQVLGHNLFLRPMYESQQARLLSRLLRRPSASDGFGTAHAYSAKLAMEQAVSKNSRVRLSSDTDCLGVPKLIVEWKPTDVDTESFATIARELAIRLRKTGIGDIDYGADPATIDDTMDSAHHMGTTRMAATPDQGVVDPDCALFDVPNVHVASSSVFCTGAAYSPTLTILALARRLAWRLDKDLSAKTAVTTQRPGEMG